MPSPRLGSEHLSELSPAIAHAGRDARLRGLSILISSTSDSADRLYVTGAGGYFLITAFSRWRVSNKVRKQVVSYNEMASGFLKHEHPLVYASLFGSWYMKLLFTLVRIAIIGVMAMFAMIALVGIVALVNGDAFGLLVLMIAAGSMLGFLWPMVRFAKGWSKGQKMAGIFED